MRRHLFSFVALGLMLMLAGFGCKGLSQEEQAAIRPITLDFWTVFDDTSLLNEWAAEYKQLRPYVSINVRRLRVDTFDNTFITALADDVGPDIVSMHVTNLAKHRHRLDPMPSSVKVASVSTQGTYVEETIVNVETIAMPTRTDIDKNYIGTVSDNVVSNGNVYGLPLAVDTLALYYNRDLLDKSGIAEPPTTWEEFLNAIKATTKFNSQGGIAQAGVALGTYANNPHALDILSLLMLQNGVTISSGNNVTFASGVSEDNAATHPSVQALNFYTDFADPTKEVYTWNDSMENAFDAFVRGKSVFYIGYAYEADTIASRAPQMTVDVIAIPQLNPGDPANVANFWIQSVVKNSPHQDEAWDFIRYITTPSKVLQYSQRTGQPSPYRTHIKDQSEDIILGPFASQLLYAENWYRGKNIAAASVAIENLIEAYREPYPSTVSPGERDAALLKNAAKVIQQTY